RLVQCRHVPLAIFGASVLIWEGSQMLLVDSSFDGNRADVGENRDLCSPAVTRGTVEQYPAAQCSVSAGSQLITASQRARRSRLMFVKRNTWGTTKYMELYIVADNTLFRRQNKDYEKTRTRIMEIANYVDKFYRALNIRVPLIGLEVWTDRDQCIVTEEPNATLWSFLQWRQKLKSRKKHDNAQLLT
ncbi:Disintegrin and metalloproteinase domain-containing protein 12, partial [Nibea albiflora]